MTQLGHGPTAEDADVGEHFTRLVAPLIAGFSLGIVTQLAPEDTTLWSAHDWALGLLATGTGLLLCAYQLSIGRLNRPEWKDRRFALSCLGVASVIGSIVLLMLSAKAWELSGRTLGAIALLVLVIGPMIWRTCVEKPEPRAPTAGKVKAGSLAAETSGTQS